MSQKRSISGIIQQQNAEAARERERVADEASRERLARVAAGVAGVTAGVSWGAGYLSGRPSSQHGDSRYYTLGDPVGGVSDISERPKSVMLYRGDVGSTPPVPDTTPVPYIPPVPPTKSEDDDNIMINMCCDKYEPQVYTDGILAPYVRIDKCHFVGSSYVGKLLAGPTVFTGYSSSGDEGG